MWFKVWANHGGGHQGYTEEFVWRAVRPPRSEREEMWEDFVARNWMHNAKGGVKLVREIPEKVRQEKIDYYKRTIIHAQQMLKVLGVVQLEPFIF